MSMPMFSLIRGPFRWWSNQSVAERGGYLQLDVFRQGAADHAQRKHDG
jgi:hypothetical protein